MNEVLGCKGLARSFHDAEQSLEVLKGIDLTIGEGEQIALMGASGSGKSTLLHILGGLDLPTAGHVCIGGIRLDSLGAARLGQLRNRALGFIYQFPHLLPEFTALENVAMPLLMRGQSPARAGEAEWRKRASQLVPRRLYRGPLSFRSLLDGAGDAERDSMWMQQKGAGFAWFTARALAEYWADGERSVAGIADHVLQEMGQDYGQRILAYFELLADKGLVVIHEKGA